MTDREKLIELIRDGVACPDDGSPFDEERCASCRYRNDVDCDYLRLADYLLANGVEFATDTNDGGKWIHIEDRLPEDEKPVLVLTKYLRCFVTRYNHRFNGRWQCSTNIPITHWMPLPEPPVEDDHG